ncbi:hypothetical protein CCYA_CCYA08G2440 [Cyanidiococcus yangmingshanensis]|nr:hypothetical protein CCYA_CCYA08G2440 [Cyanidiococcus yangmingshanensis]
MVAVGWRRLLVLYVAAFGSLLAGASCVHNWLRPDLRLPLIGEEEAKPPRSDVAEPPSVDLAGVRPPA